MKSGKVIEGDRPSAHGAALGEALSLIADLGERDSPIPLGERCLTCAFRKGTAPNQTTGTGVIALNCILGVDRDRFACHHGMKDGEPKHLCVGYIAARMASFSYVKEIIAALYSDITENLVDEDNDPIREAFDKWLTEVDPKSEMDVYQAARAWARHSKV